ncbi:MAG: DNA photolyase family protein [Deltaproteobacteria bacterium]|nr:DNA photolyase family protein [Deltaproteobacteria bacterium]
MIIRHRRIYSDILWFRRDLRIKDNPLLSVPSKIVLPLFIFDTNILNRLKKDDNRITLVFNSIVRLKKDLRSLGLDLLVFRAKPIEVFNYLSKLIFIGKIYATKENDSYSKARDQEIQKDYKLCLINDSFLINPDDILTKNGKAYTVFSQFKRMALKRFIQSADVKFLPTNDFKTPNIRFDNIIVIKDNNILYLPFEIKSIGFEKKELKYIGATEEPERLLENLDKVINQYEKERNFPYLDSTSHLSCILRFGTISIREIIRKALANKNPLAFINELIWREFFNYLLYHFPHSETKNMKGISVSWNYNKELYNRWRYGETGIPIVDAGMRQLLIEGFIHNRVRMIVASFLTKNLHIDWRYGERHFAELLIDYEVSSNVGNWQWIAGTGADPKSIFRTFNPFLQAQKFDPDAKYIKKYLPELKNINPALINSSDFIYSTRIKNYPKPIVEIKKSAKDFRLLFLKKE